MRPQTSRIAHRRSLSARLRRSKDLIDNVPAGQALGRGLPGEWLLRTNDETLTPEDLSIGPGLRTDRPFRYRTNPRKVTTPTRQTGGSACVRSDGSPSSPRPPPT